MLNKNGFTVMSKIEVFRYVGQMTCQGNYTKVKICGMKGYMMRNESESNTSIGLNVIVKF